MKFITIISDVLQSRIGRYNHSSYNISTSGGSSNRNWECCATKRLRPSSLTHHSTDNI